MANALSWHSLRHSAGIAAVGVVASLVLIRMEELTAAPAFELEAEAEVLAEAA